MRFNPEKGHSQALDFAICAPAIILLHKIIKLISTF